MAEPTRDAAFTKERPTRDELFANDAVWAAFYRDGLNLGEIAERFSVSIYDLSPWLTAPRVRAALSRAGGSDGR